MAELVADKPASKPDPVSETPASNQTLTYPLTLYIAPWQGMPNLPPDRLIHNPKGWIEAVFVSPTAVHNELARLAPPDPLYLACQKASYPVTLEWPDGSRTTSNTLEQIYGHLWFRQMLKEVLNLGQGQFRL